MKRAPANMSDQSGSSAVEFAVIVPVLLVLCLGILDGWSLASFVLYMRTSVSTAATLYMQGARDDASVKALALNNWRTPPPDAALSLTKSYRCGDQVVTSSSLCSGSTPPAIYVDIKASGTWAAPFKVSFLGAAQVLSHEQVIRVR